MILEKVRVTGFRSIRHAQELHIDDFVTVLIGANDHGKTNLLAAIQALNDDFPIRQADRNWDTDGADYPQLEWHFRLGQEERDALLQEAIRLQAVQQEQAAAEAEEADSDEGEANETAEAVASPQAIPASTSPQRPAPSQSADAEEDEEEEEAEEDNAESGDRVPTEPITDGVLDAIKQLTSVRFVRSGTAGKVRVEAPDDLGFLNDQLLGARPRVELFTGTIKIVDSVRLKELDSPEFEFMQGMFRKAGIWAERASLFEISPKTRKRLAEASTTLTSQIRLEWQQGKDLEFLLQHAGNEGDVIEVSINDPSVAAQYVQPTQRSTGFSAFFGMNMALFARKEASPANNYIFVFDEPATALHPHGQVNVQRVFQTLAQGNQIVYTTHSIFMVNKNYPTRNRAITKTNEGTLVDHKPYVGNWKAVRSNLGLIFSNNFFVADTTLLVEGPSDQTYVASLLRTCDRLRVVDIDLNLFSIVDAGNAADMVAMARLMVEEGRQVVVLLDGDSQGDSVKKQIERLNKLPGDGPKIETVSLPKHKSIEDLVVFPNLLRDAVVRAATDLAASGIRKLSGDRDAAALRSSLDDALKKAKDTTFGRTMQEVSKDWFDGESEAVSKLQVARLYDEAVEALGVPDAPSKPEFDAPRKLASELRDKLHLPEKSAEQKVVESR